ncbi:MAG: sensor histidine kinase [Sulfurimonas sp.]|jgi:signal transduction histidine kinase|uniref:7TM diverse intracellular signaling domain-containing protein n=1 Tax=Sulfurimonas sp. TaxID=2022749 RepID=UPI0035638131
MKLILLTLFLFLNISFAFESVEVLNQDITLHRSGYFKTSKDLTPLQAYETAKENIKEMPKQARSFGFDDDTYWFVFDISQKESTEKFVLDLKNPLANQANLYIFQDDKLIKTLKSGYLTPIQERPFKIVPVRFELEKSNKITTYFLEVNSNHPLFTAFAFGEENEVSKSWDFLNFTFIFSFGAFCSLVLFNLILFFITKDKVYFYYSFYMSGIFLFDIINLGYASLLSEFMAQYTRFFVSVSVQMEFIGLTFFTIYFLRLDKYNVKHKKILLTLLYINIFLSLTLPLDFGKIFFVISIFAILLFCLYVGVSSYIRGFLPAFYYLLATGVGIGFIISFMVMNQGGNINFSVLSMNFINIAIVWDLVMLSLALAYRIRLLQEENIKNEQLLMIKSRQNCISELSGNIAHQWRHPISELGAIMTNLEARLKYSTISEQEILKSIFISSKILKHLSETVNTFQGFFQHKKDDALFNVDDELKKTIDFIKDSMDNISIEVKYSCDDKEVFLNGNSNEFSQVILNIVLNAKDILIEKNIQNPFILINLQRYDGGFKITIGDNGGGIKIKPIESIFESYVTDKDNGTGIGLFIAKTIIMQKFNGKIEAYNDKDGAVFEIKFN